MHIYIYQLQERDEKEHELKKVTAELSALGVAAKQGMEAATKVKTLETDNKKLTEENKVLTENYNSERVSALLFVLFLYSSSYCRYQFHIQWRNALQWVFLFENLF